MNGLRNNLDYSAYPLLQKMKKRNNQGGIFGFSTLVFYRIIDCTLYIID